MIEIKRGFDPIEINVLKILIYGQPGLGKSTFALTTARPLVIDADNGFGRIKPQHRTNADYITIKSWQDILDAVNSPELQKYDSLVIDTAGKCLDFLIMAIIAENPKMGNQGSLTLQGYGVLKARFTDFVRQVSIKGISLVFVAHDKENKEDELVKLRPDIPGGSMAVLMREMDLVGYLESVQNKRVINFSVSDRYYTKNTCDLPPKIEVDDLDKVPISDMKYSIAKIIDMSKNRQKELDSMRTDYNQLMMIIDEKIDMVKDPESAKIVGAELPTLQEIWDSRLQAKFRFISRLASLNIGYDKKAGNYFLKPTPPPAIQDTNTKPQDIQTPADQPAGTTAIPAAEQPAVTPIPGTPTPAAAVEPAPASHSAQHSGEQKETVKAPTSNDLNTGPGAGTGKAKPKAKQKAAAEPVSDPAK